MARKSLVRFRVKSQRTFNFDSYQHLPKSQNTKTKIITIEMMPPPNFQAAAPAINPLNKSFILFSPLLN